MEIMRLLQSYYKSVLEINKNLEFINFLESSLRDFMTYKARLEKYTNQDSYDNKSIKNNTLFNYYGFKNIVNSVVTDPLNIINTLAYEDDKINRFFNSDEIYSTDSTTINIISEYRKITSLAYRIYKEVLSLKDKIDNTEDQKELLILLNKTISIFQSTYDEYSLITKHIDESVKNFEEFSKKCIDIGSNAK